jgi:hypothetical protein
MAIGIGLIAESSQQSELFDGSSKDKYVLYIGLNDQDTGSQIVSIQEAEALVNAICVKYTGGYTEISARGGWLDNQQMIEENSLVYVFYDASEEEILAIMDEALDALNQSSILIEKDSAIFTYYKGRSVYPI